jgi:hypothetical protein
MITSISEVTFSNSVGFFRSNEGQGKLRARFRNTIKSMSLNHINITTSIWPQFAEISSPQTIFTDEGNFLNGVALWREQSTEGQSQKRLEEDS